MEEGAVECPKYTGMADPDYAFAYATVDLSAMEFTVTFHDGLMTY